MQGLLREVQHVRAEERLAGFCKLFLAGGQHSIDPRQKFFRAVIRVEDDWNAVRFCCNVDVLRACDAALDWGELVFFADVFSNEELCASVGELDHGW